MSSYIFAYRRLLEPHLTSYVAILTVSPRSSGTVNRSSLLPSWYPWREPDHRSDGPLQIERTESDMSSQPSKGDMPRAAKRGSVAFLSILWGSSYSEQQAFLLLG